MVGCVKCDTALNFFERLCNLQRSKLCFSCEKEISVTLQQLNQEMVHVIEQDGVTEVFYSYVLRVLENNCVPEDRSYGLLNDLFYMKQLTDIRQGQLPTIQVNIILDTDEIAHLDTPATYYKPNMRVRYIEGRLIATNKKLYFITPDRDSMKIDWNNVVNVNELPGKTPIGRKTQLMQIQVSKGVGGGLYHVPESEMTVAIITTEVRMRKRYLVKMKENPNTRGIPDHIKFAVFQRDGGQCQQCGYTGLYIEYDHILPRSKGGLNTVANIQLLCGQCNRRKGNRI